MFFAATKQCLLHRITDTISFANEVRGLAFPLGIRAHSTQSVASSKVLSMRATAAWIWIQPQAFRSCWVYLFCLPTESALAHTFHILVG